MTSDDEFRARIGDIGPSAAPNGRARARLHIVAISEMHRHPFHRRPGEALCNPNLRLTDTHLTDGHEATCTKCLARADRYGVRIVTPTTDTENPAAAGQ